MAEASCGFVTGRGLLALAEEAASLPRRDCHADLMRCCTGDYYGLVCAVEGPRLTGKTTLLLQAARELELAEPGSCAYLRCDGSASMRQVEGRLRELCRSGVSRAFLDDCHLAARWPEGARALEYGVRYAVVAGEPMALDLAEDDELLGCCWRLNLARWRLEEWERVAGGGLDGFLRLGGALPAAGGGWPLAPGRAEAYASEVAAGMEASLAGEGADGRGWHAGVVLMARQGRLRGAALDALRSSASASVVAAGDRGADPCPGRVVSALHDMGVLSGTGVGGVEWSWHRYAPAQPGLRHGLLLASGAGGREALRVTLRDVVVRELRLAASRAEPDEPPWPHPSRGIRVWAPEGPGLPDAVVRYGRTETCRAYAVAADGDDAADAAARLAGPDFAAWLGRSYGSVLERAVLCLGGADDDCETAGVRVVDAEGFLLSLSDPACPALQNPEREVDLALFFGEGWDGAPLPPPTSAARATRGPLAAGWPQSQARQRPRGREPYPREVRFWAYSAHFYEMGEQGRWFCGETVVWPYDPGAWEQILRPPAGLGPQVTGTWLREGDRWWYQYADGSWPTGWASIEGSWCLSDGCGWMLAGWQQVGGRWYWKGEDGAMATGWREVEGKWYLFDAGGAMVERGFARHGDSWHALGPGGAMVEGGTLSVGEDGRVAFGG